MANDTEMLATSFAIVYRCGHRGAAYVMLDDVPPRERAGVLREKRAALETYGQERVCATCYDSWAAQQPLQEAWFSAPNLGTFPGYYRADQQDGSAAPLFTREIGDQIIAALNAYEAQQPPYTHKRGYFADQIGWFIVIDPTVSAYDHNDETPYSGIETTLPDGSTRPLYEIGKYSWVWQRVPSSNETVPGS